MTDSALFTLKSNNVDRFKRSIAKNIVCELRFPTVLEFGDVRLPASLVKALRKDYPIAERANQMTLGGAGTPESMGYVHVLRSMKNGWAISFKQSAISLEATSYGGYAHLTQRLDQLIKAARAAIDTDFFTRVGLRFINLVDCNGDNPSDGWINSDLLQPLASGYFQGVSEFSGRIATGDGERGILLQHGLNFSEGSTLPNYVIDIDAYRNDVTVEDTIGVVDRLHDDCFNVFDWALGDRARAYLSEGAK